MTTKKGTSKKAKKAKKNKPTKAMLKELGDVLQKHNLRGVTIQFMDSGSSATALTASVANGGLAPTPDSLNCTPPKTPTFVCKTLANGTIVCGFVCR